MTEQEGKPVTRIPVVAAVITRGNKYLICKRPTDKRHGGLWEFPGGKLEAGETTLEGTQRELREELAVEVTAVGDAAFTAEDPGSRFVIEFRETVAIGEPICIEHQAVHWATIEELCTMDLAPSDRAFARFLAAGGPRE